jgi:hypothetical protein
MKAITLLTALAMTLLLVSCTLGPQDAMEDENAADDVVAEEDVTRGIDEVTQVDEEISDTELDDLGLDVFE